ncbi:hypothetical protein F4810DRAFT_706948 [Camillea tinctor]|nr:hypothetical protein F4810DRAFT_706948 [Camillea tinctor]
MCDWEEFRFVCNHSTLRLKSYCHYARNDPNHNCYGVKMLRDSWLQEARTTAPLNVLLAVPLVTS